MALVNSILRALLKTRMSRIDAYRKNPIEVQEQLFEYLINRGKDTVWGKQYGYQSIRNGEDFKNVPISSYEQLYPYIERIMKGEQNVLWDSPISWFSKSSGTTNARSKFIPVSKECLQDTHYRGGKDTLTCFFVNNPNSELFSGKSLGIGGSYSPNPYTNEMNCGDVSALIIANLPKWAEFGRTPTLEIALMNEWEAKIEKMAAYVSKENVTNISAVPTWTVVLLEKILQITGKKNILEVWPEFNVFFHGAVAFHPYKEVFKKFFPGDQVKYYETYNASEGFFAMQDQQDSDEMLLALDNGIYFEFIPSDEFEKENPKTLRLDEVELHKNYALLISTNAGLWRYKIGDTVRFTSLAPFRIKISGRTKHFINAFGEELVIENAESAMTKACHETKATISNFTAAPVFFSEKTKAAHEWIIEFINVPQNMEEFITILDNTLREVNSDYDAKRYKDLALQRPIVHSVSEGTFYNWLKKKGRIGAQIKVPRLSNSRDYVEEILGTLK
ncbi:MAG TPA: GH3 auxin-responsive promoter family protein [Cytophagaceae bacterium]|nr:GH3 auxin-responsive promoter family protein [Cytophagaceae bacterium]